MTSEPVAPTPRQILESRAFHPVHGLFHTEAVRKNTRVFQGEGTPYLKVPGLRSVKSVAVAGTEIPVMISHEYPTDHTLTRLERVEMPGIRLIMGPDGTPILMRSVCSNDGFWQQFEDIYVEGDWDENVPPPPPAPKPEKPAKKGLR